MKNKLVNFVLLFLREFMHAITGIGSCCRFSPTCLQYSSEAVNRFGFIRGGLMAIRRIIKCAPWGRHGIDPVPLRS